jgi:hypothetical protein
MLLKCLIQSLGNPFEMKGILLCKFKLYTVSVSIKYHSRENLQNYSTDLGKSIMLERAGVPNTSCLSYQ